MPLLKLSYVDENGNPETTTVSADRFTIGRHSSCDLTIGDGRLSREHVLIERAGDGYIVSDLGSSNGTELNGIDLTGRDSLRDGDTLDLGGVRIDVRLETVSQPAAHVTPPPGKQQADGSKDVSSAAPAGLGFPLVYLVAAPILGLIVLAFAAGLFIVFSNGSNGNASAQNFEDPIDEDTPRKSNKDDRGDDDDPPINSDRPASGNKPLEKDVPTNTNAAAGPAALVEKHAAGFLRGIAKSDPTAFLTADQTRQVESKIKQLAGNTALAANLESARKNSSQISALATSKGLKPGLVAIAAVNKLGNTRGDALKTAQEMIEVLDKLETQIGNELSDDALLIIAAYEQGVAGEFLKMRNMLQNLSNEFAESSRSIRTIWFLKQNGKISQSDFDRALGFLAIGTIAQAPKDFGVSAEPLKF